MYKHKGDILQKLLVKKILSITVETKAPMFLIIWLAIGSGLIWRWWRWRGPGGPFSRAERGGELAGGWCGVYTYNDSPASGSHWRLGQTQGGRPRTPHHRPVPRPSLGRGCTGSIPIGPGCIGGISDRLHW